MFFDPLYIGLIVVTLLISGGAQLYIRSTYGRWNRVPNGARLSGGQIAEFLRERASFGGRSGREAITAIKVVPGNLSDHFDPRDRSLGLSAEVAQQPSVAAMAIAAHEVGHAVQHAEGSALMKIRGILVPAASLGPNVAYILIFAGLIFQLAGLVTLGHHLLRDRGAVLDPDPARRDRREPQGAGDARLDRACHDHAGASRGGVDAAGGGPDVPGGGRHGGADPALLREPLAAEQLTGS